MRTSEPEARSGERGLYVFGVVAAQAADTAVPGERAPGVRVVEEGALAALVRDVPLDEFRPAGGEDDEDLAWLADRVRSHEQVLEDAAATQTVLPMRFGTIYREEAAVRAFLRGEREQLVAALAELDGRREWGVKCFLDRRSFSDSLQDDAAAGARPPDAEPQSPGAAFFTRKRAEQTARERAADAGRRMARTVHERVGALAEQSTVAEPPQGSSSADGLLAASYLVAREREEEFRSALDALAAEHGRSGLMIELTGPWPPYSFVADFGPA
jgi:hypothetical protein